MKSNILRDFLVKLEQLERLVLVVSVVSLVT